MREVDSRRGGKHRACDPRKSERPGGKSEKPKTKKDLLGASVIYRREPNLLLFLSIIRNPPLGIPKLKKL
jgi:hypothetical protein